MGDRRSTYCSVACRVAAAKAVASLRRDASGLPLCAHCQKRPVKQRRCRYCSSACHGKAKHAAALERRPLCKFCGVARVSKAGGVYCGKSCGMHDRIENNAAFIARRRAAWDAAMATMRRNHADRVSGLFRDCFRALFAEHPEWSTEVKRAILRAAAPLWDRAYRNGWNARANRMRRAA